MLIWKKEFDSEPVYNKNSSKSKIKYHGDKITDFYNKEVVNVNSNHTRLAVIILDSTLKKRWQLLSESVSKEYNYIDKKVI